MSAAVLVAHSRGEMHRLARAHRLEQVCETMDGKPVLVIDFDSAADAVVFARKMSGVFAETREDARTLAVALHG